MLCLQSWTWWRRKVPELHNEKQLKEASRAELAKMCHYGPIFEQKVARTVDGGTTALLFLNLLSYLAASFAQDGGGFADLLERCHQSSPSSYARPWHGVFYSGEVHPGNQMSSTTRKTWAVYFSFKEFGQATLSKEDAWRSTEVSSLETSIGQCFKLILEHMFTSEWGNPCHGVLLKQQEKSLKLYWTVGMFLRDGSAQKHTFGNKQGAESACTAKIFSVAVGVPLLNQKARYLPSSSPRLPWTWQLIKKYLMHGRG